MIARDRRGITRWVRHVIASTAAAGGALVLHRGDFGIQAGIETRSIAPLSEC